MMNQTIITIIDQPWLINGKELSNGLPIDQIID